MYDVEKRSAPLENAAGLAKLDAYIYGPVTKWIKNFKGFRNV